ncbi:alcohol dehydrogenase catalytic domain-containing protein [Streptomyces sp. NPDC006339]|uniref:alcohol dehydrogenase catalytic domain-containing protein n=1 Tax=Streptomyces sp. NPDC006339 TaxID=3156755 RepID=UPI0033B5091B
MATHRAIVREAGVSRIVRRETPVPGPGEVLLAPEAVSLCGTDIQMLRGLRDDPSPVLGHEGACRVVAVGSGVTRVRPGDRVTVNPTHPGDPSFLLGHNVDGLFQERVLIAASAVSAGLLVPIGEELGPAEATLVEPLAVVDYAWECLVPRAGEHLVVIGAGLVGNLAAARARDLFSGTDTEDGLAVTLVHTNPAGRAWSEKAWADRGVQHTDLTDLTDLADLPTATAPAADAAAGTDAGADRPVLVLVATHRDRTVEALELAHRRFGRAVRAVHVIGGVAPDARSAFHPGVDLAGVRAANTGGPRPPHRVVWSDGRGTTTAFTGNRGVTGEALAAAAAELGRQPERYGRLLTHRLGPEAGVDVMNRLVAGGRVVDGEVVVRLVIELAAEGTAEETVGGAAAEGTTAGTATGTAEGAEA